MSINFELVSESKRSNAIASVFGPRCVQFEHAVYNVMSSLTTDYHGGYWNYYLSDTGIFLMALSAGKDYKVLNPYNFFEGTLDRFDLSIAVNLMAIGSISARKGCDQKILNNWSALKSHINTLPSGQALRRLLD